MPADLFVVAIDWYGPLHSLAEAQKLGKETGVTDFLYVGYEPDEHGRSYIGISGNITGRFTAGHHILGRWLDGTYDLWIGIVASQTEAGRKPMGTPTKHSPALHFAEHMTIFFIETSENDRKAKTPPVRSGVLLNRWFHPTPPWGRHKQPPIKEWPDFVEYDANEGFARILCFDVKARTIDLKSPV